MNLAIRGIDGSQVKWNNEVRFSTMPNKDLKPIIFLPTHRLM